MGRRLHIATYGLPRVKADHGLPQIEITGRLSERLIGGIKCKAVIEV